jgi:hypothetical protein
VPACPVFRAHDEGDTATNDISLIGSPPVAPLPCLRVVLPGRSDTCLLFHCFYAGYYLSSLFHYVLRSANPRSFHLCTNIVLLFLFVSLSPGRSI